MEWTKADPSMGVCFYVKQRHELVWLHEHLRSFKNSPIYCFDHEEIGMMDLDDEDE